MVDSWAQLPAVVTSLDVMAGEPSQLSVAVADPVAAGELDASHSIVTSAGQLILGAVVSTMVIV